MRNRFIAALAMSILATICPAQASTPHYVNGLLGLNVATLPYPGHTYFIQANYFYTANQVRDGSGKKMNIDLDLDVYLAANTILFAPAKKFLGADYAAIVTVPLVNIDYSVKTNIKLPDFLGFREIQFAKEDHRFGLSDVMVSPMLLSWRTERVDWRADLLMITPTGRYDKDDPASAGRGFWSFLPGAGATVYWDKEKKWISSLLAYYEFHTKQRQTDITPGQHFHFEWGVGRRFAKYWMAGVSGYAAWQMTKDKGPDATDEKSRAFAIGPEINVTIPQLRNANLSIRSEWEFGNRNNAQGNATTIALLMTF